MQSKKVSNMNYFCMSERDRIGDISIFFICCEAYIWQWLFTGLLCEGSTVTFNNTLIGFGGLNNMILDLKWIELKKIHHPTVDCT